MNDNLQNPKRGVLVVDDNQDGRETLALVLRDLGFVAMTARDGTSALGCAETFSPDVVLLDLLMPGISGFKVAEALRQHPKLSGVLLISMSGFNLEPDDLLWRHSGFDYHLIKPMDLLALNELLGRDPKTARSNNAPK